MHGRLNCAPNGAASRCQAGSRFARSRRRRSPRPAVAREPLERRSRDVDPGTGGAQFSQLRPCITVQRRVCRPSKTHHHAHKFTHDASARRCLAWRRAVLATRRHELGRCCGGHSFAVPEVAALLFEPTLGRGRTRPVVLSVAVRHGSLPEAHLPGCRREAGWRAPTAQARRED